MIRLQVSLSQPHPASSAARRRPSEGTGLSSPAEQIVARVCCDCRWSIYNFSSQTSRSTPSDASAHSSQIIAGYVGARRGRLSQCRLPCLLGLLSLLSLKAHSREPFGIPASTRLALRLLSLGPQGVCQLHARMAQEV